MLRRRDVKDRAEQDLPPLVRDRLKERGETVGAGDRLAVERPVELPAVTALEDAVRDRGGSIGRGDAVAGDSNTLLNAHDGARHVRRDHDAPPRADMPLEDDRPIAP